MLLPPPLRKVTLIFHILSSVSLFGAVAAFLALAVVGVRQTDPQTAWAAYIAMDMIARFVIVPLVFLSLAFGIVQSLGTRWGLFRHWWIVAKLSVNLIVAAVLLLQLEGIRVVANAAATLASLDGFAEQRMSFVVHAAGGWMVLLVPLALSIYKPTGLTRYGWRKQSATAQ